MSGQANILFVDFDYLQLNSPIYSNLDESDINWIIPISQDLNLERILGTSLYSKLKTDVAAGTLSGNFKTLLDDYITPALIYFIIVDAVEFNSIKFTNKGLIRKTSADSELPSESDLNNYKNKIESFAEYYANRTVDYLCANDSLFPEYQNPGTAGDTINPANSGYKSSIYFPNK